MPSLWNIDQLRYAPYFEQPHRWASLLVSDDLYGGGAQGNLYRIMKIDGEVPSDAFLLKSFLDPEKSRNSIGRFFSASKDASSTGRLKSSKTKALRGAPLCLLEATVNGSSLSAYVTEDLSQHGMISLNDVLSEEGTEMLFGMPFEDRCRSALHLAALVRVFEDIGFVHADIEPSNLFISLCDATTALIDYDGGNTIGYLPAVKNKLGMHCAPELSSDTQNLKSSTLDADRWSFFVILHEILFGIHPFPFLTVASHESILRYLDNYSWPAFNNVDSIFNVSDEWFEWYEESIRYDVPRRLLLLMRRCASKGYLDPVARPLMSEWVHALSQFGQPSVAKVSADPHFTNIDVPLRLSWSTSDADYVTLEDFDGVHLPDGMIDIFLDRSRRLTVVAHNEFGCAKRSTPPILVTDIRLPKIELGPLANIGISLTVSTNLLSGPMLPQLLVRGGDPSRLPDLNVGLPVVSFPGFPDIALS